MKTTKKLLNAVTTGIIDQSDLSVDNFESYVNALFSAQSALQDNLQVAVSFAITHAQASSNDFTLITKLLTLATSKYGNGMRSNTLKNYIKAVVVGGSWKTINEGGNKVNKFTKQSKKTKIKYNLGLLNTNWYEFDSEGKAKPDFDAVARAKSLMTSLTNALTEGKVKDADKANELLAMLTDFTTEQPNF